MSVNPASVQLAPLHPYGSTPSVPFRAGIPGVGTQRRGPNVLSRSLDTAPASINALTMHDATFTVPVDRPSFLRTESNIEWVPDSETSNSRRETMGSSRDGQQSHEGQLALPPSAGVDVPR